MQPATQMQAGHDVISRVGREHFAFTSIVGEGGFATVVLAMLLKTRGWYAVKEINKSRLLEHKTGYDMLLGEMKALEQIEHAFVTNLHCDFHDKRSCFFVLELKTGGDLRHYLRTHIVYNETDVAFFISCIASALNYIHSKGIIHRDIKPENIVLDEKGYPHLTDFGVAYVQDGFEPGDVITCRLASGTRQYLAPEVFGREHIHSAESDFWSLGVLAFELLYGGRPYSKHCPLEMISFVENAILMSRRIKKVFETQSNDASYDGQANNKGRPAFPNMRSTNFSSADDSSNHSGVREAKPSAPSSPTPYDLHTGGDSGRNDLPTVTAAQIAETCCQVTTVDGYKSKGSLSPYRAASNDGSDRSSSTSSDHEPPATPDATTPTRKGGAPAARRRGYSAPDLIDLLDEKVDYRDMLKETSRKSDDKEAPRTPPRVTIKNSSSKQKLVPGEAADHLVPTEMVRAAESYGVVIHNHWTFDSDGLPNNLQLPIPRHSALFPEPISTPFRNLLRGLLDPRPSHRLSDHNIDDLRNHEVMKICGIPDWEVLCLKKKYRPQFSPGRDYMENTFCSPEAYADYSKRLREERLSAEKEKFITEEQEELFQDFNYMVEPWARDLFPNVQTRVTRACALVKPATGSSAGRPSASSSVPSSPASSSVISGGCQTPGSQLINLPVKKCEPLILAPLKEQIPKGLLSARRGDARVDINKGSDDRGEEKEKDEVVALPSPQRNPLYLRARDSCDLIRKKRDQKHSEHLQKWADMLGKDVMSNIIPSTRKGHGEEVASSAGSSVIHGSGSGGDETCPPGARTNDLPTAGNDQVVQNKKSSATRGSAPPAPSAQVQEQGVRKRSLLLGFL